MRQVNSVEQLPTELGAPAEELHRSLESALPRFEKEWGSERGFEAQLAWQRVLSEGRWVAPAWPDEHGGRGSPRDRMLSVTR